MNGDTEMPVIEFAEGTDYEALYTVLFLVNKGLGEDRTGEGISWSFHLSDGQEITGTFVNEVRDMDHIVVALHDDGAWTGEKVTIKTDDIVKVVYR